MVFSIWWVIGAGWLGLLLGFLAGCCWFGICKANDAADAIIRSEKENNNG